MTDERFTFVEQQREMKSAARGARHRVCGSKSKRCTLPHEHLTPAQLRRRNGIMSTYTMNAPHTKAELSHWSQDLRREYLTGLMHRYCPTDSQLADMLGCSKSTVYNILTAYSVSRGNHRQTHAQRDAWLRFLSSDAPERDESDVSPEAIPAPEERSPRRRSHRASGRVSLPVRPSLHHAHRQTGSLAGATVAALQRCG